MTSKCVVCGSFFQKPKRKKSYRLNSDEREYVANNCPSSSQNPVSNNDLICYYCKLKMNKKMNKNNVFSEDGSSDGGSDHGLDDFIMPNKIEQEVEVITLDSAYLIIYGIIFYLPKNVRCCKEHYKNLVMYDEDFERIKIVSTSSEIPIADFIDTFKYVENDSKKTFLDSFKEMTVSEKDCENLTGLSKNNFEDLVCRLQSINNSKNIRTSLLVFLCRLRTAMSYTLMATFFGFENGDKVRHQCDKIEKIFLSHIVPYFIGVNNLHRDSLLERGSLIAK